MRTRAHRLLWEKNEPRKYMKVSDILDRAGFAPSRWEELLTVCARLRAEAAFDTVREKLDDGEYTSFDELAALLAPLAREWDVHPYTVHLCAFLCCLPDLYEKYVVCGVPDGIFFDMTKDFCYKAQECMTNYGVVGTSVGNWHTGFFRMTRFALGRLQYDLTEFPEDRYEKRGFVVHRGDPCLRIHIPSAGPLTRESREDSYRRAFDFFGERFGGVVPVCCSSWLLCPALAQILPETSHVTDFARDFDPLSDTPAPGFPDAWRVFGPAASGPVASYPEDTSMRRAIKKYLSDGGQMSVGCGAFFYTEDGRVQ